MEKPPDFVDLSGVSDGMSPLAGRVQFNYPRVQVNLGQG